jgi:hypothetical protein
MTSQINPYNINGQYPVAGQDNNSQGFRTNFTNTSTNFEYAAQEITALQTNSVLNASLTNTGTPASNDLNQSTLFNGITYQMTEQLTTLGTVSTSTTLDFNAGSYFTFTTGGSVTVAFSNLPSANFGAWTVAITVASTAHTVTFPTAVNLNNLGIQGWNTSSNTITFATTGTYTFEFSTSNGGTNITVNEANKRLQPFNNSSEDIASGGAANLSLTTTYFSTAAAETATLAAGVPGQIKTFAMYADGGDMVITVTNAGWKTSGTGTITFNTIGQGCTLQYIVAKWICIGNNGCTFA